MRYQSILRYPRYLYGITIELIQMESVAIRFVGAKEVQKKQGTVIHTV